MDKATILVLPGDGVGPEVIAEARRVLNWFIAEREFNCRIIEGAFGLTAVESHGAVLPEETLASAMVADAVLFGAMGGPEYDTMAMEIRRSGSVLTLRTKMEVFANLRPAIGFVELADAVPFKTQIVEKTDLLIVREGNGGIYFGRPRGTETLDDGQERAFNTMVYETAEIEQVVRMACRLARERQGRLCSVDKSNVLEVGRLWRRVATKIQADEFPDIELSHMLVDNCAMQLARDPGQFDVLVMSNMFGDILSDGAAAVMGSLGMAPSASLSAIARDGRRRALYEPVHGSAPDIAGQGIANPLGAIWSLAMAFRYSFDRPDDAQMIMTAMRRALAAGVRTPDIAGDFPPVGTTAMADAVIQGLEI